MINKLILCIMISFFSLLISNPAQAMFYPVGNEQEESLIVVPLSLEGLPDEVFLLVVSHFIDIKNFNTCGFDQRKAQILNLTNLMETSKHFFSKTLKVVCPHLINNCILSKGNNILSLEKFSTLTCDELHQIFRKEMLGYKTFNERMSEDIKKLQCSIRAIPVNTAEGRTKHRILFLIGLFGQQCILFPVLLYGIVYGLIGGVTSCTSQICTIDRNLFDANSFLLKGGIMFFFYACVSYIASDQLEKWMRDPDQDLDDV